MSNAVRLLPHQVVETRPFTHPSHIATDQNTLRYMAGQVCVLLEYPYLASTPPHIVLFNRPGDDHWFHRIVIAQPEMLREKRPLTVVGFFGQKKPGADGNVAHTFDRMLIEEIPDHNGLLSYSSMALANNNYANLVVFVDSAARDHWSTSKAHAQAVRELSPSYYRSVRIYNGRLPNNIFHHHDLTIIRAKYYDYQCQPLWQAQREILEEWNTDDTDFQK